MNENISKAGALPPSAAMAVLYPGSFLALPLAFFFPYHFALIGVAIGGVIHIQMEGQFWVREEGLLVRRNAYPPVLFFGTGILAAIPFLLLWTDFSGESSALLFLNLYHSSIFLFIFLVCLPAAQKQARQLAMLSIFCILGIAVSWSSALLAAFLLVHGHNFVPWIFAYRRAKNKTLLVWHWLLISLLLPLLAALVFSHASLQISDISLDSDLETILFRHTLPDLWPFRERTILLSLFGYFQFVHYGLWLLVVPRTSLWSFLRKPGGYLRDVFWLCGFPRQDRAWHHVIPWVLILFSLFGFLFLPIQWHGLYFGLAWFHVLIELPLLFLYRPENESHLRD